MAEANEMEVFYKTALDIVRKAGELIKSKVNTSFTVANKSCDIDLVTETDQAVERFIITSLSEKFPSHKFIGEESASEGTKFTDEPTWIIDPIDGTMNFVHGFPHSCISLALFIKKEGAIGIIYNPMLEQMFTGVKGKGAYLNEKLLKVSGQDDLSKSLIMMENGTSRNEERAKVLFANQQSIIPKVHGTRSLGSAALSMAMVAMGCADAYFEFGIHIWDIAAGEVIVKEAGGVVIDPAGGELDRLSRRVLCASSPKLAASLTENLEQFYPTPTD